VKITVRIAILIAGLLLVALLAGCPGMPGAPGAAGSSPQNVPPGLQPPPGEKSGGARTLMGTTITSPDNAILLVRYGYGQATDASWKSCRRAILLDAAVMVEGINFDARDKQAEKDVNQLLPMAGLTFYWKYEPKPTPPPQAKSTGPGGRPGQPQQPGAKPESIPPARRGR
jgi:hypothetical protein